MRKNRGRLKKQQESENKMKNIIKNKKLKSYFKNNTVD